MTTMILACAAVLLLCICANRISSIFGFPSLLLFMALGMLFGSDGILKIPFDNYHVTEYICSVALMFILFYGGFCTKWDIVKPVVVKASLLSSVGVLITAFLTYLFCHSILNISRIESFIIAAVTSPTDAISIFSILRSKKLSLKDGISAIL